MNREELYKIWLSVGGQRDPTQDAKPDPEAPPCSSLHERYAAFRATVERIMAREAPVARIVTDFRCMTDPDNASFAAWADFGEGFQLAAAVLPGGRSAEYQLLATCAVMRDRLGRKQMNGATPRP